MSLRARVRGTAIDRFLSLDQRVVGRRAVELYFQPDDPYSYLLAQLVPELERTYGVDVAIHAVVSPEPDANSEPDLRVRHAIRDCLELSRYYQLEFPAAAQPPDADAVARAAAAIARGANPAQIGAAIWHGDGASLPPASRDATDAVRASTARLSKRGHYMGGMMRVGRIWCWGVDRLHYVERLLGGTPTLLRLRPEREWPAPTDCDELEFFFSFRSPYSYLAIERTLALPIAVTIKPVLPMVMRGHRVPRAKQLYIVRDCKREADRLGIPFGRLCDPVGAGAERCLAVFTLAQERGRAAELLLSAARGIWSEALDVADDADLRTIVERAGLPWPEATARFADPAWRDLAERNRADLYAAGLWGVPSYRLGDYCTWGQDRIELLARKLRGRAATPVSANRPSAG